MDSAKYPNDIIHDIEMTCDCIVFPQKGYIFMQHPEPCHDSKSTRTFPERKGMPILEWPGNSLDLNPIEYKGEIGNQMLC